MLSKFEDKSKTAPMGVIFNIQRYSIHDGPGIRTTVFFKGCPLRCDWCQNPESQRKEPEIIFNKSLCTACLLCIEVCPVEANNCSETGLIVMDRKQCMQCGACARACPNRARRLSGERISVEDVLKEVLRDRAFYESSGGGVTLSGGEVTFQAEFAVEILKQCKIQGLNTAIETCGLCSWEVMQSVLEYTDLVLYDIKHIDASSHKTGTGHKNNMILKNAKNVAKKKAMKIRVPLIPEFNDSPRTIRQIAAFVRTLPDHVEMELLPYNPLGEDKFERLGRKRANHKMVQSEEYLKSLRAIVESELKKRHLKIIV